MAAALVAMAATGIPCRYGPVSEPKLASVASAGNGGSSRAYGTMDGSEGDAGDGQLGSDRSGGALPSGGDDGSGGGDDGSGGGNDRSGGGDDGPGTWRGAGGNEGRGGGLVGGAQGGGWPIRNKKDGVKRLLTLGSTEAGLYLAIMYRAYSPGWEASQLPTKEGPKLEWPPNMPAGGA